VGDLQDRIAIVTGGSGIGRGIAVTMACHGADVVVTDLNADSAEAVAGEIRASGRRARALRHDVTRWDSCRDVVREVLAVLERIDILVNNAGVSRSVPFHQLDEAEWDRVNNVNAKGVFLMMRAALPALEASGEGSIVNIASQSGKRGEALLVHYCASKAAVILLTRGAALELAPAVRVNSVCPGYVDTAMQDSAAAYVAAETGRPVPELMAEWVKEIPMGRFQQPDDVAKLVVFLASEDASEITGEDVNVTGGLMMF
jgi:meso-butanediol dehydrogenase/(S,S)-butanediol dehydrogenase/diacetyl reductase